MLCLNYLNKTVELLFILYNFAIVPSVGTGIKTFMRPSLSTSIIIVPSVGTGIKTIDFLISKMWRVYRTLRGYGD